MNYHNTWVKFLVNESFCDGNNLFVSSASEFFSVHVMETNKRGYWHNFPINSII